MLLKGIKLSVSSLHFWTWPVSCSTFDIESVLGQMEEDYFVGVSSGQGTQVNLRFIQNILPWILFPLSRHLNLFSFFLSSFNQLFFRTSWVQVPTMENNPGRVQIKSSKASSQEQRLGTWAEFQPQLKGFGWKWVKFRNAVNSTFIP